MNDAVYFRRANKVAVTRDSTVRNNFAEVASFDADLRRLGYTLDSKLAAVLIGSSVTEITRIRDILIAEIKQIKGVRNYKPMYPNFPKQVMEASKAELYLNAMFHYFGDHIGARILPHYEKIEREELDLSNHKVIGLGYYDDFIGLIIDLVSSKSAFSPQDREDLLALSMIDFAYAYNHAEFSNRENWAFMSAYAYSLDLKVKSRDSLTATDVLRLATAMSDGDVSLAENSKFKSFKRPERRMLLGLLDGVANDGEDILRHEVKWVRLGERLHPNEHKNRYPTAAFYFEVAREENTIQTFNSKVEKWIARGEASKAARLLAERPGDFARRLDNLLRLSAGKDDNVILTLFAQVADKASPTVLVQARNAFVRPQGRVRTFFPKGSVTKMQTIAENRSEIPVSTSNRVISILDAAIAKNFEGRSDLGGTYVDPALKGVAVPFGLRNASKSLKTLARGSRLPLGDDTDTLRFFIWWKNIDGTDDWGDRVDIDLSGMIVDKDFNSIADISYYNLRSLGASHSGDITSAPDGASEFIDISIDKARQHGARYVLMSLHSYTHQPYADLPECFAGFMLRKNAQSGEIYDPRTVEDKVDVTAQGQQAVPFVFDLETREAIWVDVPRSARGIVNVANNRGELASILEAMVSLNPPNLYDLFSAHGQARGGLVSKDKAKTVFSLEDAFNTEDILANYL